MKKLIVVSVIFALVAGAAFAEATLGGQLMIGTTFLTGTDTENSNVEMGGLQAHEAKMSAVFGDSKGGGKLVLLTGDSDTAYKGGAFTTNFKAWGFLYWRPVQQFRMQVGINADGDFGAAQITGWGFTGEAKNSVGAVSDYMGWEEQTWMLFPWQSGERKGNAFYPGTGAYANVNFQLFPIDPLTLTFVLPIGNGLFDKNSGNGNAQPVGEQLADFHFNAKYSIEDIGIVNLSFVGKGGLGSKLDEAGETVKNDKTASIGNIYASFYLTAIAGMNAELGLVFNLPYETEAVKDENGKVLVKALENDGYIGIGAGFRFDNGGPFTFKFRANARLGGKTGALIDTYDKEGNKKDDPKVGDMPTTIYTNILPCYKITNDLWAFLYTGMNIISYEQYEGLQIGWFVNPYIWVRAAEGLRFWAGVMIYQDGQRADKFGGSIDSPIAWRVPFGFNFYF